MQRIIKEFKLSLSKAVVVTFLFALSYIFYNTELVRGKIEDMGFDLMSKILFENHSQDTLSPKVILFGYDDLYMDQEGLFDDNNQTNYGYLFPRDHIARFILKMDDFCKEIDPKNSPKALFIDYDFGFTSLPYGKSLSPEDKAFLSALKADRPYTIYLPKAQGANFVESSDDPKIQDLIAEGKIVFVSVNFLTSYDYATRRYQAYETYETNHHTKVYPNIDTLLWQQNNDSKNTSSISQFAKDDIVANRIIPRAYKSEFTEDGCSVSQSYWDNYRMYSASCSPFDILEEDFAGAILMLGGTYSQNSDSFSILKVGKSHDIKGAELHANTLMTLYYFNGQLKHLSFWTSLALVFGIYLVVDMLSRTLFISRFILNEKLHFIIVLVAMTTMMFCVSMYLLTKHATWFNWFVPVVIFELYDILQYIKMKIDKFKQRKANAKAAV